MIVIPGSICCFMSQPRYFVCHNHANCMSQPQ